MEVVPTHGARLNTPQGPPTAPNSAIHELMRRLVEERATYREIGHAFSALADATTVRLLERAEAELGPPPVPYVWIAVGSQGRREMTAGSDQDNGLILDDAYREGVHGGYFKALGTFVCDGLNAHGYPYCPGGMMVATDRWRQPLSVWLRYFAGWIDTPDPTALMQSSVFFDLRLIRGSFPLFDRLHGFVLDRTQRNSIFLAHLARNALSRTPPIGFFRRFVLARGGEHDHTLDLKLRGVVLIIELARVHALSAGIPAVNTFERLAALRDAGILSPGGAADLVDALELIGHLRFRHQTRMALAGRRPDNHARLDEFSPEEKKRLKAAFAAVKTMQSAMAARYLPGLP